jgi:glycerol transport system substrate-binding protein
MRLNTRLRALGITMVAAGALAACGPNQTVSKEPNPNAAAEIAKFLDAEIGDMSTLDRAAQEAELTWFANSGRAVPGHGDQRRFREHRYARLRVACAGPGFHRDHRHQGHPPHLIGEGDVVDRLQRQMQSGETRL